VRDEERLQLGPAPASNEVAASARSSIVSAGSTLPASGRRWRQGPHQPRRAGIVAAGSAASSLLQSPLEQAGRLRRASFARQSTIASARESVAGVHEAQLVGACEPATRIVEPAGRRIEVAAQGMDQAPARRRAFTRVSAAKRTPGARRRG